MITLMKIKKVKVHVRKKTFPEHLLALAIIAKDEWKKLRYCNNLYKQTIKNTYSWSETEYRSKY